MKTSYSKMLQLKKLLKIPTEPAMGQIGRTRDKGTVASSVNRQSTIIRVEDFKNIRAVSVTRLIVKQIRSDYRYVLPWSASMMMCSGLLLPLHSMT